MMFGDRQGMTTDECERGRERDRQREREREKRERDDAKLREREMSWERGYTRNFKKNKLEDKGGKFENLRVLLTFWVGVLLS